MSKVWMITGAGRGFGCEFARTALTAGDRVVATGRDAAKVAQAIGADSPNLLVLALDVTRDADPLAAVEAALARFGRIDVLLNNAGYPLLGALEECSTAELEAQFRTNVFGLMSVTRAVLPAMRRQGSGHIVNVSSMAGYKGWPGSSAYSASKFAVEGLTESLAAEVAPFGIRVTLVEPGYFRTELLSETSLSFAAKELPEYASTTGQMRRQISGVNGTQPGDPAKLVQAVRTIVDADNPPLRLALGPDAVEVAEQKMAEWRAELERWRSLSVSTNFDQ
ncbi:MAG: oxidoreductase [Rhodocyclaceae bacterium]|nr:oxidoreductase [Rhodocyclaceae bacterium]